MSCRGPSITYRIAVGPRAGQKLFTLQTVPARLPGLEVEANGAARAGLEGNSDCMLQAKRIAASIVETA